VPETLLRGLRSEDWTDDPSRQPSVFLLLHGYGDFCGEGLATLPSEAILAMAERPASASLIESLVRGAFSSYAAPG
jgi:hypothetical protein